MQPDAEAATSRYRIIRARVEDLRNGQITLDQFADFLRETSDILAACSQDIYDNIEASGYYAENAEEVDMGLAGVQGYESGLNELWQYVEDGDATHLEQGLLTIWDGNQRIIEAMRINRQSREALALLWEQLQGG